MINFNGNICSNDKSMFKVGNRAFNYGDQLFETIRYNKGKLLFWEDHYFRIMGGACLLRMNIPIYLNIDFLKSEILKTIHASLFTSESARVRLTIYRKDGGKYLPKDLSLNFLIEVEEINEVNWDFPNYGSVIDVFHDHKKPIGPLSNVKGVNSIISVLSSIYAKENNFNEVIILNTNSFICESTSSNLFIVKDNTIITPPISSGCIDGVIRKQIIEIINESDYIIQEKEMRTFELIKANEIFLTNSIVGIQWVSNYKNRNYSNKVSSFLFQKLIASI